MAKTNKEKQSEEIQNWTLVFPNQANPNGVMFGGDLLAIMDTTAAMAAKRFCHMEVATVSVEAVHFAKPIRVGDTVKTSAKVVAVGNTSMVVKTLAYRDIGENQLEKCVSAYFFLVAFGLDQQKIKVPRLQLTETDTLDHQVALAIQKSAKQRRQIVSEIGA